MKHNGTNLEWHVRKKSIWRLYYFLTHNKILEFSLFVRVTLFLPSFSYFSPFKLVWDQLFSVQVSSHLFIRLLQFLPYHLFFHQSVLRLTQHASIVEACSFHSLLHFMTEFSIFWISHSSQTSAFLTSHFFGAYFNRLRNLFCFRVVSAAHVILPLIYIYVSWCQWENIYSVIRYYWGSQSFWYYTVSLQSTSTYVC